MNTLRKTISSITVASKVVNFEPASTKIHKFFFFQYNSVRHNKKKIEKKYRERLKKLNVFNSIDKKLSNKRNVHFEEVQNI